MNVSGGHIIKSYLTNGEDKVEFIMIPGRGMCLDTPAGVMIGIMDNEYYLNGKRAWIECIVIDI